MPGQKPTAKAKVVEQKEYVVGMDTRKYPGKVEVLSVTFRKRVYSVQAFMEQKHHIAQPHLPEFALLIRVLTETAKVTLAPGAQAIPIPEVKVDKGKKDT